MSAQRTAMGALNIASGSDVERLEQRLRSLSGRLEALEDRLDELVDELAELRRARSDAPSRAALGDRPHRRSPERQRPRGLAAELEQRGLDQLLVGPHATSGLGDHQHRRDRDSQPLAERQQRRGLQVGDRRPGSRPGGARLGTGGRCRSRS